MYDRQSHSDLYTRSKECTTTVISTPAVKSRHPIEDGRGKLRAGCCDICENARRERMVEIITFASLTSLRKSLHAGNMRLGRQNNTSVMKL